MGIHKLLGNCRSLQAVDQFPRLPQIRNHRSIGAMDGFDRTGVDLQGQFACKRILPAHWEDLDVSLVDGR